MNSLLESVTVDRGHIEAHNAWALIELPLIALGCLLLWPWLLVGCVLGIAWYLTQEIASAIVIMWRGAYWLARGKGEGDE